jgi:hypothetical protein
MSIRQDQIPSRSNEAFAPGALRPVAPGLIAIALLLALTASVATASVAEPSNPACLDRREAPRELTVRWLASAVAKAARDLAASEIQTNAVTTPAIVPMVTIASIQAPTAPRSTDTNTAIQFGWSAQGLLNLPPPQAL